MFVGGHGPIPWMRVPIIGIVAASLGNTVVAFGFKEVWEAFLAIRFLFGSPSGNAKTQMPVIVLRFLMVSFYAMGGLFSLFWLLITLAVINGPVEQIGDHLALAICSLAFPILISEGLLRPLKNRLEFLADPT